MIKLVIIILDKSRFYKYDRDSNLNLHFKNFDTLLILLMFSVQFYPCYIRLNTLNAKIVKK